ncbi:MAG: cadherin repeat domain-containing protein, partial [Candidatus Thiodiazotropha endolucinida]
SPTPPSETDLINGTGAAWHGSLPITSIGTKTFNATGLSSNTVHYAHYLHDNSGSRSAISTSSGVATDPGGGGNQAPVINDQSFNFVLSPNSNLLTNGDFSNGETGWDDANNHWLIESGRAHHPSSNAFNILRQSIVSSQEKIANVSFDYEILTGNLLPGWWTSSGGFISAVTSVVAPGSGSYSENVIVPANAEYLGFNRQTGTTLDAYLDNVSVVQLSGCSIIGTVQASDPDGDPLTFSIIAGNTDNDITIDTNTGELSWANVPDVNRTAIYNLTIQVSDGTDIDTGVVTIYVVELVYRQGNTISLSIDIGSI